MHQFIGKKKYILFIFLFFLTSINSQIFVEKKDSLYDLNHIEVVGLNEKLNMEIKKNLNFVKKMNIFFLDKEILEDQINKYNFIESYNISILYPSKIIIKLKQTKILGKTYKDNEVYLIGSNGKFIDIKKFNQYKNLPIVYGKFNPDKFIFLKNIIYEINLNYNDIKEIFFYPSGRSDIKTIDGVLIKLPINNVEEALIKAKKIMNNKNLKNNVIDLRVSNQLILSNE